MTQSIQSVASAFYHDPDINEIDGGRVLRISYDFTASVASIETKLNLADVGLMTLQSVFIDNSANGNPVTLLVRDTNQRIVLAAQRQGYFRILAGGLDINVIVSTTAAIVSVPIHFINLRVVGDNWESA